MESRPAENKIKRQDLKEVIAILKNDYDSLTDKLDSELPIDKDLENIFLWDAAKIFGSCWPNNTFKSF